MSEKVSVVIEFANDGTYYTVLLKAVPEKESIFHSIRILIKLVGIKPAMSKKVKKWFIILEMLMKK